MGQKKADRLRSAKDSGNSDGQPEPERVVSYVSTFRNVLRSEMKVTEGEKYVFLNIRLTGSAYFPESGIVLRLPEVIQISVY
jgi:hypothetical protein